jgi:hypothetical protein
VHVRRRGDTERRRVIWDPGSVWEITFGAWAPTPKKFVIHLDDIRFE